MISPDTTSDILSVRERRHCPIYPKFLPHAAAENEIMGSNRDKPFPSNDFQDLLYGKNSPKN